MSAPSGASFVRLRLRDGYAVTYYGRLIGHVYRADRGWYWEPLDGPTVWGRADTRGGAAQCLIDAAPGL